MPAHPAAGAQPVIACPARSIEGMRVPAEWAGPIERGRLLVVSSFAAGERRATAELARERNRFVAALAGAVFVAHAAPGGKTEALCREVAAWGKSLLTLASEQNANVEALGARAVRPGDVAAWWAQGRASDRPCLSRPFPPHPQTRDGK